MKEEQKKVLRKLERRRELPQQLVAGVQELREDGRRLAGPFSPVPAARREPVAKSAPVLRHEHLPEMNESGVLKGMALAPDIHSSTGPLQTNKLDVRPDLSFFWCLQH